MLLIPCPHCGFRDEAEFTHGGAAARLPALDGASGAAAWHEALHLRDPAHGPRRERWYHHAGCECWIEVARDLRTHAFAPKAP